jgi:hypothetical protein
LIVFFNDEMNLTNSIQALGSERRLQILQWLKQQPARNFPPQRDGRYRV